MSDTEKKVGLDHVHDETLAEIVHLSCRSALNRDEGLDEAGLAAFEELSRRSGN